MLSLAKVDEVRRLLARGNISQRQIARDLGISRGSVAAIASGKRPNYPVTIPNEDIDCSLPPIRCQGCGGLVHAPCRLCRVRSLKARDKAVAKARLKYLLPAAG
ncbi:MAG TPA: helix-turn-helix domain-containing protein [Pirellulales bacterium]|nr:helix-turn-helix domain-containing protein [Pirellulales bacterium]